MKRTLCTICVTLAMSPAVALTQTAEETIGRAVLAAPAHLRADAMVVALADDGSYDVLREGSNGLVCWDRSDEPGRTFSVQCTAVGNLARVSQNRAWNMSGEPPEEIKRIMSVAEADGSREVPEFGSVYYSLDGDSPDSARSHMTIAVPFATSDTLGLPDQGRRDGVWLMDAGTSSAHIMVPGR